MPLCPGPYPLHMLPEEQEEEIQVLESIYGSCFTRSLDDESSMMIELTSTPVGAVQMSIRMPPEYPHVTPEISLTCTSHKLVISDAIKALNKEAQGLMGMAMIFSLITFLEDWIAASGKKGLKRLVIAAEENAEDSSATAKTTLIEEKVLAAGTPVTRETFLKWQKSFLSELGASNSNTIIATTAAQKLTGKQLFEQNKALAVSDTGFAEEGDEVVIDEALFANIHFNEDDEDGNELVYDNNGNISD